MKITVRFVAFNLREALIFAAWESLPSDACDALAGEVATAREDRYREVLTRWLDEAGRIEVEFDTKAGTARVLRRDGKDEAEPADWFLLYGGSSVDGSGPGRYEGRTRSYARAVEHAETCSADPYSTGYVLRVNDKEVSRMTRQDESLRRLMAGGVA